MQSAGRPGRRRSGHIDTLAKAAKRAGDRRPIDHIRADLFLGMTGGTYTGFTDADIINQLLAAAHLDESDDKGGHHNGDDTSGDDCDAHGDEDSFAAPTDPPGQPAPGGAGMELRVRLSTLLGHEQYPAELAGWGPVARRTGP